MEDFVGTLATSFGGVGGAVVGFVLFALVFLGALLPLFFMARNPNRRMTHTGLERFAASLDTPDEGYHDRIPPLAEPAAETAPPKN